MKKLVFILILISAVTFLGTSRNIPPGVSDDSKCVGDVVSCSTTPVKINLPSLTYSERMFGVNFDFISPVSYQLVRSRTELLYQNREFVQKFRSPGSVVLSSPINATSYSVFISQETIMNQKTNNDAYCYNGGRVVIGSAEFSYASEVIDRKAQKKISAIACCNKEEGSVIEPTEFTFIGNFTSA